MAPVRRYLRITKYSVLECRIYLDNPALAQSWLLNPRYNVLPRVIESVRPLVLPKLREEKERERLKKKASKKSRVKDVIVRDDFEVSFFLMETNTRHSLLTKKKNFRVKGPGMIQSNTTRLIDETNEQPVDVEDDIAMPIRLEEDSDEDTGIRLADIPSADESLHKKRDRSGGNDEADAIDVGSDDEVPPTRRRRGQLDEDSDDDGENDKKKMAMDVSYEGFAIYGRVLCLVVKRTGEKSASQTTTSRSEVAGGQAKMENFLSSTQVPVGEEE